MKTIYVATALFFVAVAPTSFAKDTCQTTTQKKRGASILGGMAEGFINSKLKEHGITGDYSARRTMREFLTDAIACVLSEKEQQQALDTQKEALDSGKTGTASKSTWKSDERPTVGGGTTVTSRSVNDGKNCAVYTTFITDENGQEKSVQKEACQNEDGSWS